MLKCKICHSHANFFCKKNNFLYYLCQNCQTLFIHPLPDQKQLKKYYQQEFDYLNDQTQQKTVKLQAKKIINKFIKLLPTGKTLLDIGSGYGFILQEAEKKGIKSIGLEPSKKLCFFTKHQLKLKVFNLSIEEYLDRFKNQKFDFISLIHVIEHLHNPKHILQLLPKLLNNNGVIYIETPNLNSHLFKVEKKDYTFLTPPDHIWIFSLKSFKFLLKKDPPLKIIKSSTSSQPEHFTGILKKLLKSKKKPQTIPCQKFIPKTSLKRNPKNMIKKLKFALIDRLISKLLYKSLNCFNYGSVLELYIRKRI